MSLPLNILVISDLHLGEDLGPSANEATARHVDLVEEQLVAFFRHYTHRRSQGRPWRVVVNGDMVDFMAITILPNKPELARLVAQRGEDDDEFGLRRTVNATLAKVKMVAERHAALFDAMARFISTGNELDIIAGNHDIEFHWPNVQAAFTQEIIDAFYRIPAAARPGSLSEDVLRARVNYHPWFYYEENVAWIEHGHQYDENCAFDYNLNPLHPTRHEILSNVDTASTRYLTNYVKEIDAHAQEDWSGGGYVRFAFSLGIRGTLRMAKAYYSFARALLSERKATIGPRARRLRLGGHRDKIGELASEWKIGERTLRDLDGLRRTPIVSSMRRLMSVLMLDKVLIVTATLLLAVLWFFLFGLSDGALLTVATMFFARFMIWFVSRNRNVDPAAPLMLIPGRILDRVNADYVVFGHTHKPVRKAVSGGTYFNTGTWLPSGKPGLLRAFTHVVIRHDGGHPSAELCQWRDGGSRPFAMTAKDEADFAVAEALAKGEVAARSATGS